LCCKVEIYHYKKLTCHEYRQHAITDEKRGAGVLHPLHHQARRDILEGTLYPLLTRLKNAELLTYRWVESSSGPPRKYFSMTEKGEAFYLDLENTWNELANAVHKLTLPHSIQ
jgi:hypothetical protein